MEGETVCLRCVELFIVLVPTFVLGRAWWRARKRAKELQGVVDSMSNAMARVNRERERR